MLNRRGFIGSALIAVASLFTGWRTTEAAAPLPPAEEPWMGLGPVGESCCAPDPDGYIATLVMYDNAGNEYCRYTLQLSDLKCGDSEIVFRTPVAD